MRKNILLPAIVSLFLVSCNQSGENKNSAGENKDTTGAGTQNAGNVFAFVYGIDISKFQGDEIEFLVKKNDSLSFVICKATEGITVTDAHFINNWNTILKKGFIRAAYHFYHSQDDPVKQAAHFLRVVDSFSAKDLPPIIDVEDAGIANGQTIAEVSNSLILLLKEIKTATGRTPIIYTDYEIGNKYLDNPVFAGYPLWIADYSSKEPGALPGAWKGQKWVIWQKSENYLAGSTTNDFDVFNGSISDLKNFISNH